MDPETEYQSRRNRWQAEWHILQQRFIVIGNWRLALGLATAVLAYFAFGSHRIPASTLLVPFGIFIGLAFYHARVKRRRTLAERALRFYDQGLARVQDRWAGTSETGELYRDPEHVYADDLDLYGKGSLFELISRARTAAGESVLASWLSAPALAEEALARQDAVRELTGVLDLREDIALLGEDIRGEVRIDALTRWGSQPAVPFSSGTRILALVLAIMGPLALIGFFAQWLPLWPLLTLLIFDLAFARALRNRIRRATQDIDTPAAGLRVLSLLLARLGQEPFASARLRSLQADINLHGFDAAHRIARLERWIDMLDSSDHLLVRAIQPLVVWREQAAMAIEAWRCLNGRYIGGWVAAVAEIESLSSVASLAYERPGWTFPQLLDGDQAQFDATDLRHPLIPESRCVPNSVHLGAETRLLIVSGSNMSGKSTLLRAVGLTAVLAWAGAPVPARAAQLSRLQTTASMRVTDSLQDNRSRFYAEITRIRNIVQLASRCPTLFLLDELLSGTNSHDRRIGASAILTKLVTSGAIGLITTHDLALADIEDDLHGLARNVHFDDYMRDGKMEFEFKLRPGIVTHSNALELMRSIGLEV